MAGNRRPGHVPVRDVDCPVAAQMNRDGLSLPCSVGLTEVQERRVIDVLTARQRAESR